MNLPQMLACIAVATLAACASTPRPTPAATDAPDTVLMLSIDGLSPDALGKGNSPHLDALARGGVQARWMQPSYPAITFPNHYTLVTGLRPDRHGLIHNSMHDPSLGRFELKDVDAVRTPGWWNDAVPLWLQASRHGLRSGTWSYPGGETAIDGQLPDQLHPYDESLTPAERAQHLLDWLDQPDRLHFIAGYFEHVDQAGHAFGPDSPQHQKALRTVDAAIGTLVDGLRLRGQLDRINLMVVSDHGMAVVPDGQVIAIEDIVPHAIARNVSAGQVLGFDPQPGQVAAAEARLIGRHDHYACWKREDLPARWQFGQHRRVPPIICQMDEGWDALSRAVISRRRPGQRGSHGYDPALPSMRAVFIAHGPAFRQGVTIDPIDNVDVYPLVNRLLHLDIPPNDGQLDATQDALRH